MGTFCVRGCHWYTFKNTVIDGLWITSATIKIDKSKVKVNIKSYDDRYGRKNSKGSCSLASKVAGGIQVEGEWRDDGKNIGTASMQYSRVGDTHILTGTWKYKRSGQVDKKVAGTWTVFLWEYK
jgi:hypothetical protein